MKFSPPPSVPRWNKDMSEASGLHAVKNGKIGLILLAGGSGSRLGWKGPKGTFPITPLRNRSLLQFFADRVDAASTCYQTDIQVAVMTSKDNHEATVKELKESKWIFRDQLELPYLDKEGHPLSITGPDGNGGVFEIMGDVLKKWKKEGISLISILPVDNPLADPIDLRFFSFHLDGGFDLTVKVVERESLKEKVGFLVETEQGLRVIEYTEQELGMEYPYGNAALYLFSMDLALEAAEKSSSLPYHSQWKKINDDEWGWKRERLIFDHFPEAKKIGPLLYPRDETFVPLKEMNHLENVRRAITEKERKILEKVTGKKAPSSVIEIDPRFYYPDEALKKLWRGKDIPETPFVSGG